MAYTKRQFGAELILELEKGYNREKIAIWAEQIRQKHLKEIDDELYVIIEKICLMSFGEQFEYSKAELIDLAINLIKQ
ncbi:hypothetical protein GF322_00450 [Candidatus Dependentiae bacterium]|nr:hypothetical protein [Candidatus Dependentiae bacterium]